ncbi:hypothetical protein CAC42_2038 [Sphaceloma murrayae]|uniref:Uncharacterized protein n=1 Tax=Sphaceloma murrayae TaxID=2082308 RepID=A0A2K1QIT5_9PEZI|nr:hypothetical protein CAC42_2038 [Sphaceloma murrayae]
MSSFDISDIRLTMAVTVRRWIITLGVAVITVSGAYAGANLAVDHDARKERRAFLQASPAEQISQLQMRRQKLVNQRGELEKKLEEIVRRQEKTISRG